MQSAADEVVRALDAAVRSPESLRRIDEALRRTAEALRHTDQPMTWETIPLEVFSDLPSAVLSCWVFMLRSSRDTGAERHPNSHQRSLSLTGEGYVEMRQQLEWRSYQLSSEPAAPIDARWVTIPPNTWHRWRVGPTDWGVLSFHTVAADQLIEERPLTPDDLDEGPTGQRRYQDQVEREKANP